MRAALLLWQPVTVSPNAVGINRANSLLDVCLAVFQGAEAIDRLLSRTIWYSEIMGYNEIQILNSLSSLVLRYLIRTNHGTCKTSELWDNCS